jgi:hypothetical protein
MAYFQSTLMGNPQEGCKAQMEILPFLALDERFRLNVIIAFLVETPA